MKKPIVILLFLSMIVIRIAFFNFLLFFTCPWDKTSYLPIVCQILSLRKSLAFSCDRDGPLKENS